MNEQKRNFSSMHTHTIFCDGKDDIETMCRAAYENKLYAIGFSAHAPIAKQIGSESEWNLRDDLVEDYVTGVLAAKQRWQGKLKVFLGYEVDYIKDRRSPLDSDIASLNLDYTIGSVHYLYYNNNFFTVDGPKEEFERGFKEGFGGDALKLMSSYYDAVLEMITAGGFDILGHVDLLKKNLQGSYLPEETETIRQREIAAAAKKAGLVVEVNTGGLNRKKINELYPSLSFLKILREFDIPVIITADAHCAKHISGNYNIAVDTLVCANFKEHVLFKGRINGTAIWQKENL